MPRPPTIAAVDLFCGVGGLSHGLRLAGIETRLGVDIDPNCRFPFEANNGGRFLQKSVADLRADEVREAWNGADFRLLAGCAPCQPFSNFSQATGRSDERRPLALEFARLVEQTLPDYVAMENVPQMGRQDVFAAFADRVAAAGYEVWHDTVRCDWHGVPQQRQRLVLLASRHGRLALDAAASRPRTVREAIGDLPPIAAGGAHPGDALHRSMAMSPMNLERIRASTPETTWKDWPDRLRLACHARATGDSYTNNYRRMAWDEPAPTVTTQFFGFGNGRFGHPEQDRPISLREGAILQSFPRAYAFVEPGRPLAMGAVGRLIGNAVPVLLARAIGASIVRSAARRTAFA